MAGEFGQAVGRWFGGQLAWLFTAWPAMLGLGVLHARYVVVPALGYGETFLVLLLLNVAAALIAKALGKRLTS